MKNLPKADWASFLGLKGVGKLFTNYFNSQTCTRCILREFKCLDYELYRDRSLMEEFIQKTGELHDQNYLEHYDKQMLIKNYSSSQNFQLKEQEKKQGTDTLEKFLANTNICTSC